ncbi:MAG: DUF1905 domain-containing protein [Lachnospiraceae bacterium]|jgi:hypothetical protein|nr:DUF1905 domain-containing protein [Lachnospiraceae bacterium]MBP5599130.1 DUF1905 domain-containing protein [Lachnospiraceae bacterium]MBR5355796.1 DUF1905 domain-containing protein [Lachnospiraceae bacterium]
MKYSFISAIEKAEAGGIIKIPFNVWEICKKEGDVPVKVKLQDSVFVCNLIPEGNGVYSIPVSSETLKSFEIGKEYPVTFRVTKSSAQESPYSTSNPIRKIDSIEVIKQPHDGLCGQSCVAMLAGISLDEAINTMHCGEWQATMDKIINALNYFGIDHSEEIIYTNGRADVTLPKCCVVMEKMGRYSHYLVYFNGVGYDSNLGLIDDYDVTKVKGYMEVYV